MSGGLRILCLDGGGTRGLSTIYLLREIMDRIAPGNGGDIRPCEYFDMIGASGPNGLLALMFTRFSFTIKEALKFFHDFASRLDAAEDILLSRTGEELDDEDFDEDPDPDVVIETVRRQVVCNTFRDVVLERVTDWLERSENKEGSEFSYKYPGAVVGVGRCRAAIMGSESPGHGPNKGVVKHRVYHAPLWHKSYTGRHTRPTYTWWAIGLGTMGSPGIVSNGVIFPDFWATGAHSDHNPVLLLLQECSRIWPGLKAKLIISIGTGNLQLPELWNLSEHPHALVAAKACLEICEANQKKALDLEKYVLPHDDVLRSAYFRFDVPADLPFFESEEKDLILAHSLDYIQEVEVATSAARAVDMLEDDTFPDTWEDQVAFSSLGELAMTFLKEGYPEEGEFMSDAISSYILYESAKTDSGSHRKLVLAAHASKLAMYVEHQIPWGTTNLETRNSTNPFSIPFYLNSLMAYDRFEGSIGSRGPEEGVPAIVENSEFAAACYYLLTSRHNPTDLHRPFFTSVLRRLAADMETQPELTPTFISRVENLLKMSSFATLCELAYKETLSGQSRIIQNPNFLRYYTQTILQQDLSKFNSRTLDPVATVAATLLNIGTWSTYRDPLIIKLLSTGVAQNPHSWAFANLAVERITFCLKLPDESNEDSECLKLCYTIAEHHNSNFQRPEDVAFIAVKKGYNGLLRKILERDIYLESPPSVYAAVPRLSAGEILTSVIDDKGNNLLHITAQNGYLTLHKMIVELLGTVNAKPPLARLNNSGLSPLHIATKARGHKNILLICLFGGGNINQLDAFGRTPLHYCFPEQKAINEYLPALEDLIKQHNLCLTLAVTPGAVWGSMYNSGKKIDNRTYMLRTIIRMLYCRGGSITIQDEEGATPPHLAARNGWGINSDLFFIGNGVKPEEESEECLRVKDKDGNTVLALMRRSADVEGERIIAAEMRKRFMDTSIQNNLQIEERGPTQNIAVSLAAASLSSNTHQMSSNSVQYHPTSPTSQSPAAHSSPPPTQPPHSSGLQQSGNFPSPQTLPYHQRGRSPIPPPTQPQQPAHYRTPSNGAPPLPPSPLPQRFSPSQSPQQHTFQQYHNPPPPQNALPSPYQQQHNYTPPNPNNIYRPPPSPSQYPPANQPPANPNIYRPPPSPSQYPPANQPPANPNIYRPPVSPGQQPQYVPQETQASGSGSRGTVGSRMFNKLKKRL